MMDNKKFINLIYNEKELKTFCIGILDKVILISSNIDVSYFFRDLMMISKIEDIDYSIIGIVNTPMSNYRENYDTKMDYLLKTEHDYDESQDNKKIYWNDKKYLITNYPYKSIQITSKNLDEIFCVSEFTLRYVLKQTIKKISSQIYFEQNYYAIHASCVADDKNAYIFLADSNSGKSTIFMSLLLKGFVPVNDDIVFTQKKEPHFLVESIPISPSIRKDSLKYLPKQCRNLSLVDELGGRHSFNLSEICEVGSCVEERKIKAIFLPEYGFSENKIYAISSIQYKKTILKSFLSHNENLDRKFIDFFNEFLKLPFFKIELNEDMESFANRFVCFLKQDRV